jgi:CRISPR/Cas system-associated exonuclease Cas4 (RecB family)
MNESKIELGVLDLVKVAVMGDERSRSKTIHVTAITGPCMRKPFYELQGEPQTRTYESQAVMKLGTIVHELIVLNKNENELSLAGNIRNMQYLDPKKINHFNFFDCISGKVDDIVQVDGEPVIVDKKTYSSVTKKSAEDAESKVYFKFEKREVDEDYVFQLNEYKLLYFLKTGVDIKKGAIVYLDTATRFARPRVFEVCLKSIEEIKAAVLAKLDVLKLGVLPERTVSWRCNYICPYKSICKPEEDPKFEELTKR